MTRDDVVVVPRPCPFCGGEAKRHWGEHSFNDAKVRCEQCHAEGPMFDVDDGAEDESGRNEIAAIAAWNTRASPSASAEGGMREKVAGIALDSIVMSENGTCVDVDRLHAAIMALVSPALQQKGDGT